MQTAVLEEIRSKFGDNLQENVPLSGYTAARLGGPADLLLFAHSANELAAMADFLWKKAIPFHVLGSGSNVLVADKGIREVVIINRARNLKFNAQIVPPTVHAESGVTPNDISQRAARLNLAGFEWAASIPGSLGGAVYGNAGAFGGEMSMNLVSVDLVHQQSGRQVWPVEKMEYGYRTSILKKAHLPAVILAATLELKKGDPQSIRAKMEEFSERRKKNQPPGASMGSMFKNPAGDKAGRLIEAAGLKGKRIGNAEISPRHANFFINHGQCTSANMKALIDLARETVHARFGISLELEVELLGEW
jgi:UDP-N-acetylmuramate dehydrogenase